MANGGARWRKRPRRARRVARFAGRRLAASAEDARCSCAPQRRQRTVGGCSRRALRRATWERGITGDMPGAGRAARHLVQTRWGVWLWLVWWPEGSRRGGVRGGEDAGCVMSRGRLAELRTKPATASGHGQSNEKGRACNTFVARAASHTGRCSTRCLCVPSLAKKSLYLYAGHVVVD